MSEGKVVLSGVGFLEAPRWHDGELWFSDFFSRRVSSIDEDGRVTERAYVAGQPSGLGFCPDGTQLIVSTHDGHLVRRDGESQTVFADVGATYRGGLNDMVVDRLGRAYVSSFPVPAIGKAALEPAGEHLAPIIFVDENGKVSIATKDLRVANGMVITPDGQTLIAAETLGNQLLAFDIASDGTLSNQRTFADLGERKPDGICLDVDGNVWVGSFITSEFVHVAEGGKVLRVVPTPGRWAVACALGGRDGKTLYGLTAKITIEEFLQGHGEGAIEAFDVDAPGA
jgi:sugar lactone lactonase YvrE